MTAETKMTQDEPEFSPRFFNEGSMGLYYEDGRILAAVDVTEGEGLKGIVISEWSSRRRGRGHTVQALRWMREQGFNCIVANGVGALDEIDGELVGDISTLYWAHMKSKYGLVDVLLDDSGAELHVAADGSLCTEPVAPAPGRRRKP